MVHMAQMILGRLQTLEATSMAVSAWTAAAVSVVGESKVEIDPVNVANVEKEALFRVEGSFTVVAMEWAGSVHDAEENWASKAV
jgi:hypothetical protein